MSCLEKTNFWCEITGLVGATNRLDFFILCCLAWPANFAWSFLFILNFSHLGTVFVNFYFIIQLCLLQFLCQPTLLVPVDNSILVLRKYISLFFNMEQVIETIFILVRIGCQLNYSIVWRLPYDQKPILLVRRVESSSTILRYDQMK